MPARSADENAALHAGASFRELVVAYEDCRRTKRNTRSALEFEERLEHNLVTLFDELAGGTYRPGPSICFVVTHPKPREVWAAGFRDRVVHHLLYNHVGPRFERAFIADTCACIAGRGTLYAAQRLEAKVRSVTANWSRPAWYLKCDLANFFVAIDKDVLAELLETRIAPGWWRDLAEQILFHDPRPDSRTRRHGDKVGRMSAQLGDGPIQAAYHAKMNELARFLDQQFNGGVTGPERQTCFVLLVYPFGQVRDGDARCNFISNGADRKDIVALFKEMIARFEGQPHIPAGRA